MPPHAVEDIDPALVDLDATERRSSSSAPSRIPPTPAKGSSTRSPRRVKNRTSSAMAAGGLMAPWHFRKAWVRSAGAFVSHTVLVKKSHSLPLRSFRELRAIRLSAMVPLAYEPPLPRARPRPARRLTALARRLQWPLCRPAGMPAGAAPAA